jgi:hypothetical protein
MGGKRTLQGAARSRFFGRIGGAAVNVSQSPRPDIVFCAGTDSFGTAVKVDFHLIRSNQSPSRRVIPCTLALTKTHGNF